MQRHLTIAYLLLASVTLLPWLISLVSLLVQNGQARSYTMVFALLFLLPRMLLPFHLELPLYIIQPCWTITSSQKPAWSALSNSTTLYPLPRALLSGIALIAIKDHDWYSYVSLQWKCNFHECKEFVILLTNKSSKI